MSDGKTRKRKYVLGQVEEDELKYLEKIVLGDGNDIFNENKIGEGSTESDGEETPTGNTDSLQPAWIDHNDDVAAEDGETIIGQVRGEGKKKLSEYKFAQMMKQPKWAKRFKSKSKEDTVVKQCGKILIKSKSLKQGTIQIKKLKDLNSQTNCEGSLNAIKFHPTSSVGLVAGMSGIASLFQVDGKENTKLQSIQFHRFPIKSADFIKNGEEFIVGSKMYKHFYKFNLMTGQTHKISNAKLDSVKNMQRFVVSPNDKVVAVHGENGAVHILSAKTLECIDNLQMNANVSSIAFNANGSKMYCHSDDGNVYVWDMNSRNCIEKFLDEGCYCGTSIDVSSNDAFLACGSNTGVVNIYEVDSVLSKNFTPLKTFYNLVTPVTDVKFNPTSELLSISSNYKDNAIRLIHMSSRTVFSNFPGAGTNLKFLQCCDFSPNSGYFAIGSGHSAHLFRLKYYHNY